jgi:glycosyltransferase involved in cell wall biosynthesis
MRIAIDCSPLAKTITGIGTYTYHLVKALCEIDNDNDYFLLAHRRFEMDFSLPRNFEIVPPKRDYAKSTPFLLFDAPKIIRERHIELFHGTNFLIPPRIACKSISTVHDLSSIVVSKQHSLLHRISHGLFLESSLRRADKLIAVSEFTEGEILRLFPQYSHKITVIHEAASPEFRRIDDSGVISELRQKFGLPERFALFVGTLEPRKNVERLIEAFAEVRDRIDGLKLVIAGGKGWLYDEIFAAVQRLHLEDRIVFSGYIPFGSLPALYSSAEFFCYPSLYGGFGLPVLEAMACGTPVLTSMRSSMSEVAGDAALLADPEDVGSIADCILKLALDKSLRENLAEKGLRRAENFSWQKCAIKTLDIYEELIRLDCDER